jgi:hypothetical protein
MWTRDHEVWFWQVYAPLTLSGMEINERVLYILGCTSPNCGLDPARFVLEWVCILVNGQCVECEAGNLSLTHHTCFDSWCTIRFQKNFSQDGAAGVDQTESVGDLSAKPLDCASIPSNVLHVHGYGEKLKPICIYGVLIALLINIVYCLYQQFLVLWGKLQMQVAGSFNQLSPDR